jgi:Tfp pilus assembly protein PilX
MKHQQGSTLVVSLILLTIITLVAVYALEGSSIQSKMVANSLFSTLTYQECRNEQEAEVRFFNENGGANRSLLITAMANNTPYLLPDAITKAYKNPPASQLNASWVYIGDVPAARSGFNIDIESTSKTYIFNANCTAVYHFSTNNQTLGASVEGLQQAGNIN